MYCSSLFKLISSVNNKQFTDFINSLDLIYLIVSQIKYFTDCLNVFLEMIIFQAHETKLKVNNTKMILKNNFNTTLSWLICFVSSNEWKLGKNKSSWISPSNIDICEIMFNVSNQNNHQNIYPNLDIRSKTILIEFWGMYHLIFVNAN